MSGKRLLCCLGVRGGGRFAKKQQVKLLWLAVALLAVSMGLVRWVAGSNHPTYRATQLVWFQDANADMGTKCLRHNGDIHFTCTRVHVIDHAAAVAGETSFVAFLATTDKVASRVRKAGALHGWYTAYRVSPHVVGVVGYATSAAAAIRVAKCSSAALIDYYLSLPHHNGELELLRTKNGLRVVTVTETPAGTQTV